MTDRELLELAAKAAGIKETYDDSGPFFLRPGCEFSEWRPLEDDGDALRLAARVNLQVDVIYKRTYVGYGNVIHQRTQREREVSEDHGSDPNAATRRAIVRAAAAMATKGGEG